MGNDFRRKTDTLPTCMNCGSVLYGGFCSHCGQKSTEEITLQRWISELRRRVIHLEDPWLRTAIELTRSPGKMIRGYLRGRRLPYVGPLAYSVATATLLAVSMFWWSFDLSSPITPWGSQRIAGPSPGTFTFACFSMLWVSALVAWLQRSLFRQARYNVTQTWVFDLYVFGHLAILQTLFAGLGAFASNVGLWSLTAALILGLTTALGSFYRRPLWTTLPAALILGTVYIAGIFTSAALFRKLI